MLAWRLSRRTEEARYEPKSVYTENRQVPVQERGITYSATRNVAKKLEKKNAAFLTAFFDSLTNKEKLLDAQTDAYPNIPLLRLRTDGSGEKEKIKNALKRE